MEIKFLLKERRLLLVKYIKLIRKKDFDKIIIEKNDIKFVDIELNDILNEDLIIRVLFKNFNNDYIFNITNIQFKTQKIIFVGALNDPLYLYNQKYIENFKLLTDKKDKISWYELDETQKYYYLRGCYLLNGVRESIDNMSPIITIDFTNVKTDLDIYYELGKSFFKSYGYFGTEFHSFRDCLASINESLRQREIMPTLNIKGYKNFKHNFYDNILFDDFYKEFTRSGLVFFNS